MTTAAPQKGSHSFLGPSSAERWFNCSGSINLIRTLPPEAFKSSKYADEGTVAHQIAEELVSGRADFLDLTSRIGSSVMHGGHEIEIIEEMIDGAVEYAEAIAKAQKTLIKPIDVVALAEQRVHASTVNEAIWGTADYVLFQKGNALHVFDYKFGKGVVEVEENKQMLTYAIAVEDTLAGTAFDKVFLWIVQPRARHADGTVRCVEVTPHELKEFRALLAAKAKATEDPKAKREAGPWCKFCPALAYCPEARDGVQAAAKTTFTAMPAPPSKEVGVTHFPDVNAFTPDQLARALEWEDAVDSWFEAIRARALAELAKDPHSVPGYKLVEGKTNRQWSDEIEVKNAFALIGDKLYAPRKILSPTQLEKVVGKEEVARWTVKPQGKLTVARATDKRDSVSPASAAAEMFDAITLPQSAAIELKKPEKTHGSAKDFFGTVAEEKTVSDAELFGDLLGPTEKKVWP